jgi:cbb3-type cytochrome oxidase subunit 3
MIHIILAIFQILIAIGFIGFWIYFFAVENKNPENSETYLAFERAFPVPDLGFVTPSLFVSAVGLFLNEPYGIFFTIVSGSALLFLGLLDISFNIQNGGYTKDISDTIMNLFINLVCVIFGPIFLIYGFNVFMP